jgi:hypothetical protein
MKENEPMWILYLNDMRSAKFEYLEPVVRAETKEALKAFLARNEVESYVDEQWGKKWGKSYRKGGPLEWFNHPRGSDEDLHFVDGEARLDALRMQMLRVPWIDGR